MPGSYQVRVVGRLILCLPSVLQAFRINALHPDKHLGTTGPTRFRNEICDLVTEDVDLHHESDIDLLFFPEANEGIKNSLPLGISGKIVISEKVEIHVIWLPV